MRVPCRARSAPGLRRRLREESQDLYAELLAQMERFLLTRVLMHTAGNQVQAARILGITRGSLRTKGPFRSAAVISYWVSTG